MRIVSQSSWALVPAFALALTACSLEVPGPPEETPIELKLDFCANDTPIWFAIQAGSGPFEIVTPNTSGTFTFQATSRVTVAYVRQRGSDYRTDIIYTTNEALAPLRDLACVEHGGAKGVNGTMTGHTGTQIGLVSLSTSYATVGAGQTAWTLTQLVDRPLDLIASRIDVAATDQHTNKTILRRSQNPANGATIAALNFDSEGFAPVIHTLSVNGVGDNDHAVAYNSFGSSLGTSHTMTFVDNVQNGAVTVEAVPGSDLATNDFHKFAVIATAANGSVRTAERYFATLDFSSLALGPQLTEPSVIQLGTGAPVRLRTQVLGQVDYSTMINMAYHSQTATQAIDVSMTVTASYFSGTPVEWNLPMPNFDGLPGWQSAWGLKTGSVDWRVTGYFGRPQLLFGAPPNVGETMFSGSRSSSLTATSVLAAEAPSGAPRPGHFGPFGPANVR